VTRWWRGAAIALVFIAAAWPAHAQQQDTYRFQVGGGIRWIGALAYPAVSANETAPGGGSRPLFQSMTTLDASPGAAATLGYRLTSLVGIEAGFAYNPTGLTTRITSDAEGLDDISLHEPVKQFLVEGGVVAQASSWRARRFQPLLTAGVGYVRQLNEGRTLVQNGRDYYVGAGVCHMPPSARPGEHVIGFRADVRALVLQKGVAEDTTPRVAPSVTASVFVRY
jgi:opacity protein-like surface antigen